MSVSIKQVITYYHWRQFYTMLNEAMFFANQFWMQQGEPFNLLFHLKEPIFCDRKLYFDSSYPYIMS